MIDGWTPKLTLIAFATLAAIILAPRSGYRVESSVNEFSAFADSVEMASAELPGAVARH